MFQFQYIEFLLLLIIIPVMIALFYYAKAKKRTALRKIGEPELVQQLIANHLPRSVTHKAILLFTVIGLLVITLANLRSPVGEQKISRSGIDVMIALDVSKSMLAQDVKPSRLDRSKQLLSRLVDKLGNNRIGIVIFAGKAYLQMPLTGDHAAAKMYLSAATTESVPTQGTVIGDALKMCYASFNNKEKKYKAVILISDGEDHDESAVKVAEQMAESGVIIHTVGIGSPMGAPLMDESTKEYKQDAEGNTVISKLNETALRQVAENGHGVYQLYQNTEAAIGNIMNQLNSMEQKTVTDNSLVNYKSYYLFFLIPAFLFLLIELFIAERKKNRSKSFVLKPAVITVLLFFLIADGFSQEANELIGKGNKAYKENDFKAAGESYSEVAKKNPGNAIAHFNLGNAAYKSGKTDEAVEAYDQSISRLNSPIEKSNAFYNKGVVYQNNKKLPECIEAYKSALKLDPANEDARQNLQKALKQQKKEQEQKQQQNQEKQKQN